MSPVFPPTLSFDRGRKCDENSAVMARPFRANRCLDHLGASLSHVETDLLQSVLEHSGKLGRPTMSEDNEADRSRCKKRRGQLDREKETRRAEQSRSAHAQSKTNDATVKLDLRIGKLVDEGYSVESVAKRMGLSMRRINAALDANRRRGT